MSGYLYLHSFSYVLIKTPSAHRESGSCIMVGPLTSHVSIRRPNLHVHPGEGVEQLFGFIFSNKIFVHKW